MWMCQRRVAFLSCFLLAIFFYLLTHFISSTTQRSKILQEVRNNNILWSQNILLHVVSCFHLSLPTSKKFYMTIFPTRGFWLKFFYYAWERRTCSCVWNVWHQLREHKVYRSATTRGDVDNLFIEVQKLENESKKK